MNRPTATPATGTGPLLSAGAAFTAGLLFGARPRNSNAARTLVTIGAAAFATLALLKTSEAAVRKAGTKRRASRVRFSLVLPRPVEQVFALCADFENFPRFIPRLQRVIDYGDGRSNWCAYTPGGGTIEWNTITTKFVTNSVIGWRSVPGSEVNMSGLLRFSPEAEGTCVRIVLDYEVTSSTLRDAVAALLAPRNATNFEEGIRALAKRLAEEPSALARELPAVISSDDATRRGYGADVTG
jgi:uncharacterized membrane protein